MSAKSLPPLVYGPVNSGGDQYDDWGETAVLNRHTNFLGVTDEDYLVMHRYDYHQYNDTAEQFATDLNNMGSSISADMAPESRFPVTISEFNVHTNDTFDTLSDTVDTSAWNLPAGTPFLLEEVSEDYYGAGRRWAAPRLHRHQFGRKSAILLPLGSRAHSRSLITFVRTAGRDLF